MSRDVIAQLGWVAGSDYPVRSAATTGGLVKQAFGSLAKAGLRYGLPALFGAGAGAAVAPEGQGLRYGLGGAAAGGLAGFGGGRMWARYGRQAAQTAHTATPGVVEQLGRLGPGAMVKRLRSTEAPGAGAAKIISDRAAAATQPRPGPGGEFPFLGALGGGAIGGLTADPDQRAKGVIGGAMLGGFGLSRTGRNALMGLPRAAMNHPGPALGLGTAGALALGAPTAFKALKNVGGPGQDGEPWKDWDAAHDRLQGLSEPMRQEHQAALDRGDVAAADRILQQMNSGDYGGSWSLGGLNPWASRPASYYKGKERAAAEAMQAKYRELMKDRVAQPGDTEMMGRLQQRLTAGGLSQAEQAMIMRQLDTLKRRGSQVGIETTEAQEMRMRMLTRGLTPQPVPRPSSYGGIGGFGNNYGGPLPPMDFIYGGYPRDRRGPGYDMGFMDQSFSPYTR